jgi:hypothetical protein
MTDPERISHRSSGLAAELLRAGATEQPRSASIERTLVALGVSGAVLTGAATASAAAATGAVGVATAATGAKAVKAMSTLLLVKWIGVGVVGGVGLAGAAAVVTEPAAQAPSAKPAQVAAQRPAPAAAAAPLPPAVVAEVVEPPIEVTEPALVAPAANAAASEPSPALDVGAPLAAEVAFIDRARALLSGGQTEQGLSHLRAYEQQFPEARLLPEVLFLRFETCERLGRHAEARLAAQRLVDGFPKSPHATRARKLLQP